MSFGQYSSNERPSKPDIEVKSKKRLAHIFDNPAHVWAHPLEKDGSGFEQTEAWNKGKNFYFKTVEDDTRILYSYRDSYPIASRVQLKALGFSTRAISTAFKNVERKDE